MSAELLPFVSVVVPTADRRAVVEECLERVLRQDYPADRYEVVVVDDGSRDDTAQAVRRLAADRRGPDVRCERRERRGPGAARNAGVAAARGELVCFLDDDALAPAGWLRALVAGARRHPDAAGLGGPVRPRLEQRPPRTCAGHELAGMSLDPGPADAEVDELWGCNMALRRHAAAAGGFDERLRVAEDWDWGRRVRAAGGRLVLVREAGIEHRRLASDLRLPGLLVEYYRRGYVVGVRDPSAAADGAWGAAGASLRHAVRARCTRGLTDAARTLGLWCGARVRRGRAWARGGAAP
jgi:glycosyltransferase involved in cell wall biosynthesis